MFRNIYILQYEIACLRGSQIAGYKEHGQDEEIYFK